MSEHLFLGDSTYPHTQEIRPMHLRHFGATVLELKAADRIERLERELAEAQKDASRLDFVCENMAFIVPMSDRCELTIQDEDEDYHVLGIGETYRDAIDAAIKESK